MNEAHDLSFVGLFLQADIIVKSVMALLAIASVICWTIIFEKMIRFSAVKRHLRSFETAGRSGDLQNVKGDLPNGVLQAGMTAWQDYDSTESRAERRERIERAMKGAMTARLRRLEVGLPFLATIGSAGPFIGLFGTVWGIMNSFSSIAQSQDTSLAVVAPGIAEALFATAIGLVAAIPAVMAYNKFSVDLGRIAYRTGAVIADVGNRLARDRKLHRAEAAE
ncbi:MotA/TolQ/ExbB proton channel family protein [Terrihabitans rhizophilus]|jgi:TolQ protein|uniref:MotA/TolQ/ExbB proton channel family protein n=1 Tax=Terrihabitans rhizophilus TaxID=3092662 RepID=A0ABU4RTJ5_9HYPH|nr:MotA/TolQ/ExbB proton channel family protein [Terrihabitans sp. PJ23]MDX6806995.1 MotA/TolQ/ExbB proton channel family protein [Terrihabitans sp. PJ23]